MKDHATDSLFSRHITSKDTSYCKACSKNEEDMCSLDSTYFDKWTETDQGSCSQTITKNVLVVRNLLCTVYIFDILFYHLTCLYNNFYGLSVRLAVGPRSS